MCSEKDYYNNLLNEGINFKNSMLISAILSYVGAVIVPFMDIHISNKNADYLISCLLVIVGFIYLFLFFRMNIKIESYKSKLTKLYYEK